MVHRYALPLLITIALPQLLRAQADNCASATSITVVAYGACGGVQGNNASATDSGVSPSCDPTTIGYKDVWYTFNTGSNTQISVTLTPGSATDWNFMIYDACGGNEIACETVPSGAVTYTVPSNTTYKLQVESNLQYGNGGTFTLCIEGNAGGGGGNGPANDDCVDAAPINVVVTNSCGALQGTTTGATGSGFNPSCDASATNLVDVWYTFNTGSNTSLDVTLSPISANSWGYAIFDGCNGNELVCVAGSLTTESYTVSPNSDFWLMVWSDPVQGSTGTFTLCLEGPNGGGTPPANDVCSGATVLTVGNACVMNTTGDVANAVNNGTTVCDGDVMYGLWYRFIAPNATVVVRVDGSSLFDPVMEIVQGGCGSTDVLDCVNNTQDGGVEEAELNGLVVGATYYVHVYQPYQVLPSTTTFTICAYSPPAFDECAGALPLTMQASCVPVTGDAGSATGSNTGASCNQAGNDDDDVWYSFVATAGDVRITVDGNGTAANGYDPVVHLRYGCPGTSLACTDQTGAGGTEVLDFQGITPGNTYYIQIYDDGTGQPATTTFTVCVQDMSGVGIPALNGSPAWQVGQNEATGGLRIVTPLDGNTLWELMDATGRALANGSYMAVAGVPHLLHDIDPQPAIYLVRVSVGAHRTVQRVLIK